jgi:hypothetical protein
MPRKGEGKKAAKKLAKRVQKGETARRRAKVRDLERQAKAKEREIVTGPCRDEWRRESALITGAARTVRRQTSGQITEAARSMRDEARAAARVACAARVQEAQAPILQQLTVARRDLELFAPQVAPRSRRLSTAKERAAEELDEIRGNIAAQYPQYLAAWDQGGKRRFTEGTPQERFERFIEAMEESPSQALGAQSAYARRQLRRDLAEQGAADRLLAAQYAAQGDAPASSVALSAPLSVPYDSRPLSRPPSAPASFSFGHNVAPPSSRAAAPPSFALAPVSAVPSTRRAPRSQAIDAVAAIVGEVPNWTSADPRQAGLFAIGAPVVAPAPLAPAPRSVRYDMPPTNGDQVGMFGPQQYRLDDVSRLRR